MCIISLVDYIDDFYYSNLCFNINTRLSYYLVHERNHIYDTKDLIPGIY